MVFTFWEQAVLNGVGPLVTIVLGSIAVTGVAGVISRRVQNHREQMDLRRTLASEMSAVAYDLYFRCAHLERGRRHGELVGDPLAVALDSLDQVYVDQRIAMGAVWSKLKLYFGENSYPSNSWHRVVDLSTLGYFQVRETSGSRLAELTISLAGDQHAGLSERELRDPILVRNAFEPALLRSTKAVLVSDLAHQKRGR